MRQTLVSFKSAVLSYVNFIPGSYSKSIFGTQIPNTDANKNKHTGEKRLKFHLNLMDG